MCHDIISHFLPLAAGFLLTARSLTGSDLNGTLFRFAQRSHHHDSKQPVLIAFTEEDLQWVYASANQGER